MDEDLMLFAHESLHLDLRAKQNRLLFALWYLRAKEAGLEVKKARLQEFLDEAQPELGTIEIVGGGDFDALMKRGDVERVAPGVYRLSDSMWTTLDRQYRRYLDGLKDKDP